MFGEAQTFKYYKTLKFVTKSNRHFCASPKNPNIYGAQKLDSLHFMVIPLHSLPSSFPPSREVNCKQIYKSQHCFSALKQSGTIIPCLYKHNFALLECTADEVYASTQGSSASHPSTRAGCVSEGTLQITKHSDSPCSQQIS